VKGSAKSVRAFWINPAKRRKLLNRNNKKGALRIAQRPKSREEPRPEKLTKTGHYGNGTRTNEPI
jgi:hypothetical protein